MSLRKLYYHLPPHWRLVVRKLAFAPIDIFNGLLKRRSKYEPPKGDIYTGAGDFIGQGRRHLQYLIRYLDLKKEDAVLDIGSGIGRTAVALTGYLSKQASYEGFDVVEKGVRWCNQKIKEDFPQFNFTYVPLHNDLYNQQKQQAAHFRFPYPDKRFDKAFLFSVFTHMQPPEVQNYLKEIRRVLKADGSCLATFFIYNETVESSIADHPSFSFPVAMNGYRLMDREVPSANIAFSESLLHKMVSESGLQIKNIVPGYWQDAAQKSGENDFQDMVILGR